MSMIPPVGSPSSMLPPVGNPPPMPPCKPPKSPGGPNLTVRDIATQIVVAVCNHDSRLGPEDCATVVDTAVAMARRLVELTKGE